MCESVSDLLKNQVQMQFCFSFTFSVTMLPVSSVSCYYVRNLMNANNVDFFTYLLPRIPLGITDC